MKPCLAKENQNDPENKPHKPHSSVPSVQSVPSDRFKFRVWDNLRKEYNRYQSIYLAQEGGVCYPLLDGGMTFPDEDSEYIIEQCTGLKDKHGQLIYEGDIVNLLPAETEDHKERIVIWEKDHWTTVRKDGKGAKLYWNFGLHEVEIVGNIHQSATPSSAPSVPIRTNPYPSVSVRAANQEPRP